MAAVEENEVAPRRLEYWQKYMEKNYARWVKFAERYLERNVKLDELILVRGWAKTLKWVIATLDKQGEYVVRIDTSHGLIATVSCGGEVVPGATRSGAEIDEACEEAVRKLLREHNLPTNEDDPPPKPTRCIFIRGLKMERDFLVMKKIVAAGKARYDRPNDDSCSGESAVPAGPFESRKQKTNTHCNRRSVISPTVRDRKYILRTC